MQDSPNKSIPFQKNNLQGWSTSNEKHPDFEQSRKYFVCHVIKNLPQPSFLNCYNSSYLLSRYSVAGTVPAHSNKHLCDFWKCDQQDRPWNAPPPPHGPAGSPWGCAASSVYLVLQSSRTPWVRSFSSFSDHASQPLLLHSFHSDSLWEAFEIK